MSTNRVKAYTTLVGSFLLGAITAGATYHAYAERKTAELFSGDREAFEERRVQALRHELELDSDQAERVRAIFGKYAPEHRRLLREAMQSCGAPLDAHRELIDREIGAVLTPAQKQRFDAHRAERKRRLFGSPAASGVQQP